MRPARVRAKDRDIIAEVPGVYGNVPVRDGDVVLDLGAHIGLATRLLLGMGAKSSIAVEPDPDNLRLLRHNTRGLQVKVIAAAVGPTAGRIDFYPRPDRPATGSVLNDDTRKRLIVPMVAFADLLDFRPTIVKCDIEFAEYTLPELRALPDHVRVVAMEVHIRYEGIFDQDWAAIELRARREAAADLLAAFDAQGFRTHWRKDKQAKPGNPPAEPDATGLGLMTKCVCVTFVRP